MTHKEIGLLDNFLKDYVERLSCDSCNDCPELNAALNKKELTKFVRDAYKENGDPENFSEDHLFLPNWWVVNILRRKFLESIEPE